jgi:anti-sigma-K factor RskA
MKKKISVETLTAYVLGELSEERRVEIAELIEKSRKVREAVSRLETTVNLAINAFSTSADSGVALTDGQRERVQGEAERMGIFDGDPGLFGQGDSPSSDSPFDSNGGLFAQEAPQNDSLEGMMTSVGGSVEFDFPVSVDGRSAVGERNENSVLFSLRNLQKLASESMAPPPAQNETTEEASGLIDIRALTAATHDSVSAQGEPELVPEALSPMVAAPILAVTKPSSAFWFKVGAAAAIVLLSTAVAAVILLVQDEGEDPTSARIAELERQIKELSDKRTGQANDEAIAALKAELKQKQTAEAATPEPPMPEDTKAITTVTKSSSSSRSRRTSRPKSSRSSGDAIGQTEAPSAPKQKSAPSSELDDLLGGAGAGAKPKSRSVSGRHSDGKSSGGGMTKLTRADVQKGMANVAPAVKRCGQGKGGTITMNVVIGKNGRVSTASAVGAYAGTPIGSCAARAVRRARFPASSQTVNVKYPFKL